MVGNFGGNKTCYWSLKYFKCHANHLKSKQEKAGCCIKVSHSEDCQLESKLNNSTSPIQSIPKKQFSMQCQTVCSGMQVTVQLRENKFNA